MENGAPYPMRLYDYEAFVDEMWKGQTVHYTMIALAGEVGELCNLHKKGMRDPTKYHDYDYDWHEKLMSELGDVLYYLTRVCHEHSTTLGAVMEANVEKLRARHARSTPTPDVPQSP
jgi:NTP pyrophosphatase (non-canonical NTP hydrolase)